MDAAFAVAGLGILAVVGVALGTWLRGRESRQWEALARQLELEKKGRARFPELVDARGEVPVLVKHMRLLRGDEERLVSRVISASDLPMAPGLSLTLSPTRHVRVMGVKVTGRYGDDLSMRYAVSCKDDALADAVLDNPMVKPLLDGMAERRDTAMAVKANTVQVTRPWLRPKEVVDDVDQAVELARHLGLAWKAPFVQLASATGLALEKTHDAWAVRGQLGGREVRVRSSLLAGRVMVEAAVQASALPEDLRVRARSQPAGGELPELRIEGASRGEAELLLGRSGVRALFADVLAEHPRSELRDQRVVVKTSRWPSEGLQPVVTAALSLAEALDAPAGDPLLRGTSWEE